MPVVYGQNGLSDELGVGYGAMSMVAFYGPPMDPEENQKLLKAAYDAGCRHFDSAEIYKSGNPFQHDETCEYSETRLGQFVKTIDRNSVTIVTKYMPPMYGNKTDYDTVKASLDASLKRLDMPYVDLYYCHRIPSLEGAKEFMAVGKRLVEEGLIKHVGLSEISGAWLREANAVYPVAVIQQEWSLMTRNLEEEIVPVCKELGIGIVCYSPLARSLLATPGDRPADSWLGTQPRFTEENWAKNVELSKQVNAMAEAKGASAAQLSLAWLLHKGRELGVMVLPIPGSTKIPNVLANLEAVKVELTTEEMRKLEEVAAAVAGARGDESYQQMGIEGQK